MPVSFYDHSRQSDKRNEKRGFVRSVTVPDAVIVAFVGIVSLLSLD